MQRVGPDDGTGTALYLDTVVMGTIILMGWIWRIVGQVMAVAMFNRDISGSA